MSKRQDKQLQKEAVSTNWPKMEKFDIEWYKYVQPLPFPEDFQPTLEISAQVLAKILELGLQMPDEYPKFPYIVLDIVQFADEPDLLRMASHDIPASLISDIRIQYFMYLLLFTVLVAEKYVNVPGVGLSAIQVGVPYNMFWAFIDRLDRWEVFINPKVSVYDDKQITANEGCLSILGVEVPVPRYKAVKIKYINGYGSSTKLLLKNFDARVVQHEFDHTLGKLILDYKR